MISVSRHHTVRARGFALILVLVVIALVSLSAYTLCDRLVVENESAQLNGKQLQARALVDSGASHVLYFLEQPISTRADLGGTYNNPQRMQAQLVAQHAEPRGRGRFSVMASLLNDQGHFSGWRFGLEDESARLNLKTISLSLTSSSSTSSNSTTSGNGGGTNSNNTNGTGNSSSNTGNSSSANSSSGNTDATSSSTNAVDLSQPTGTAGRDRLMRLPGMTLDVADAILDWIDLDSNPREYGAEQDYYSGMTPPYAPRNGAPLSIEELLLVRGVTPELLFGRDINRNGMLDMNEQNVPVTTGYDDGTGSMDLGWAAYLTVFSQDRNVSQTGTARVNINASDLQTLQQNLSAVVDASWVTFILAYRIAGPYTGDATNTVAAGSQELDLTVTPNQRVSNLLDLVGAKVQIRPKNADEPIIMHSPLGNDALSAGANLAKLTDLCTVDSAFVQAGRININQAPRSVLLTIPGMTSQIADGIISQRDPALASTQSDMASPTWPLTRALVTLQEMRTMLPYINTRGDVYRGQIVGYFDAGDIGSRAEVVFDATTTAPTVLSWKDLTHLGRGFAREILGVSGEVSSELGSSY